MEENQIEDKNIFEAVKRLGIEYDNHCSDLYIPRTAQTLELCKNFGKTGVSAMPFVNQLNGKIWLDIPFAYIPYWEKLYPFRNPPTDTQYK
jgi:hypothetical protein